MAKDVPLLLETLEEAGPFSMAYGQWTNQARSRPIYREIQFVPNLEDASRRANKKHLF